MGRLQNLQVAREGDLLDRRKGDLSAASLRAVGLGDDGEEGVRRSQKPLQRRNPKRRGSQKYQVHEGSSFDGFSLVALPFALEDLTLDFAHAIPDEQTIQVIDFMLKSPREIATTFQHEIDHLDGLLVWDRMSKIQ